MPLYVLLLLYHNVTCLLTYQNISSLSYEFTFTCEFLVAFIFSQLYIFPGYDSIDIQFIYLLCFQHSFIFLYDIFYILPKLCILSVSRIINSHMNLCSMHVQITICVLSSIHFLDGLSYIYNRTSIVGTKYEFIIGGSGDNFCIKLDVCINLCTPFLSVSFIYSINILLSSYI